MKKLYLFLLAVIFISLTACTTDNEELIIWAWNQNVAIMEDAVSKYKEINPTFNAKVESFSQGDIQTKFISAKELNQPENLADIMLIDAMNLNVYYDQWPSIFYDFSDKVNDQDKELFVESTIQVSEIDNRLIAMPYGIAPTYVFAYKDLWDEEVLEDILENGWTWDDYKTIGLEIKQNNPDKEVFMTAYNLRLDDRLYRTMTSQKGEWFTNNDATEIQLGNANSTLAMTWVNDFYESGVLGHIDTGDYRNLMLNGQIAAQIQGFFLGGQLKSVAPDSAGDWLLLPLPEWEKGKYSASITGGTYLYVNNLKDTKESAAEFVKWYTTNVDALVSGLKIGGIFPAVINAYEDPYFKQEDPFFGNQAYLEQVASNVALAPAIYASKYNSWIYDQFALAQEKILFNNDSIQNTLNTLKDEIQTYIQN